ncbi:uncharacterized protein LOC144937364 [Lampetra fluviatilis]
MAYTTVKGDSTASDSSSGYAARSSSPQRAEMRGGRSPVEWPPRYGPLCYNCGRTGHIARNCWLLRPPTSTSRSKDYRYMVGSSWCGLPLQTAPDTVAAAVMGPTGSQRLWQGEPTSRIPSRRTSRNRVARFRTTGTHKRLMVHWERDMAL